MRRPRQCVDPFGGAHDAVAAHPPSDDHKTWKKHLAMNGIAIDQIAGGKTVESWGAFDNMSVLVSQGYTITPPNK